jgi:hypothetical protein
VCGLELGSRIFKGNYLDYWCSKGKKLKDRINIFLPVELREPVFIETGN